MRPAFGQKPKPACATQPCQFMSLCPIETNYSALSSPRARCSRAHCATMMPTSANGMTRCQPSERPTWTAVARIFGSSSHDGACARAARSRMARSRARRRANRQTMRPMTAITHKDRRHHQAGIDAAHLQRQPVIGGNAQKCESGRCRQRDDDKPNDERRGDPGSRLNREHHVVHQALEHGGLGSLSTAASAARSLTPPSRAEQESESRPRSPASYRGAS